MVDWDQLSNYALPIINRGPGISVILGTFTATNLEMTSVERKKKLTPVVREEFVEMQTPDQV